jgi:hypothetical protein
MIRTLLITVATTALASLAGAQQPTPTKADFSTPEATVMSMILAVAANDADVLSASFSPQAEEEFEDVRTKKLTRDDWAEFKGMFDGARVLETFINPDTPDEAVVRVQLKEREERIYLAKEGGSWRIRGF